MHGLTADLEFFSLSSLLQLAESDQITGAFRIEPEGSIVLRSGSVVQAVYGRLTGIDAVLTLLMVASKRVEFEAFQVEEQPRLLDTMALIIDGARLNDDWGNLAPRVLKPIADLDVSTFKAPVKRALKALNGKRIVEEALDLAAIDVISVIDALLSLREIEALQEVAPPRPDRLLRSTATPTPAPRHQKTNPVPDTITGDFFDLVDASRTALRSKNYAQALLLLESASTLRPDDRTVIQNIRRIRQLIEKNNP